MTPQEKLKLVKIIRNYFIELEKKQSAEQIKEVDKKGLWNADLISATFEELSNGIATVIIKAMKVDEEKIGFIIYKFCGESIVIDCANGIKNVEDLAHIIAQNTEIISFIEGSER